MRIYEGNDAVARVDYALGSLGSSFYFRRLSQDAAKTGKLVYENPKENTYQVIVNDKVVIEKVSSSRIEVNFGLDDRLILRKIE